MPGPRAVQAEMLATVLAGGELTNVAKLAAEAVGGPVAIAVPRLGVMVCSDDEACSEDTLDALREWVSDRGRGRPAGIPRSIHTQVPVGFRGQVVGVVALLDHDGSYSPLAVEYLDGAAVATLMRFAVEDPREETENSLRGSFLEELRAREDLSGAEITRRARRLGCELSRGGMILCSTVTGEHFHLVLATIAAECPGALAQQLDGGDDDARPRIYAVLPACGAALGGDLSSATQAAARRLSERLGRQAIVALSGFRADPAELCEAIREAELVLEVLRHSVEPIDEEIGSGTYKLLFRMLASHPEEIRTFYEATVAPLVRYDDRYNTELIRTLQAYLNANCNMNATAAAIFAHRHTIAYRLERIKELTGLDPNATEHRERLGIGLKVHRIVAAQCAGRR